MTVREDRLKYLDLSIGRTVSFKNAKPARSCANPLDLESPATFAEIVSFKKPKPGCKPGIAWRVHE